MAELVEMVSDFKSVLGAECDRKSLQDSRGDSSRVALAPVRALGGFVPSLQEELIVPLWGVLVRPPPSIMGAGFVARVVGGLRPRLNRSFVEHGLEAARRP
ncbi:hypothetical protein HYR69_00595 [Candidatus Sumerlaeota bacterium]|nr:hypothetical protein [Candidatus Sumerlaeota bacterium]